MDTWLAAGGLALAFAGLTALLVLACAIGLVLWRRERAAQRRLAAAHGYIDHGFGEFGAELPGVSWRCAPHQDDDSGRAWTEFNASATAPEFDASRLAPCDDALAAQERWPEWMDTHIVALWRQAQGQSTALRLLLATHNLSLVREDGLRRATPLQVCALAALGQACVTAALAMADQVDQSSRR